MENKRPLLVLIYLAITVAVVWLMQFLWGLLSQAGMFIVMLLIAWILTVGALGPVRLLRRLNIPRLVAAVTVFLGLLGLGWCIIKVSRAKRAQLDDEAMRVVLRKVVPLNMGALFLSVIGLMMVILGISLS